MSVPAERCSHDRPADLEKPPDEEKRVRLMKKILVLVSAAISMVFASPAAATTFLGDTFEADYQFPREGRFSIDGGTAVVSPTALFTFPTGRINPSVEISATSILISFAGNGRFTRADFNGILLRNLSRSMISAVLLSSASTPQFEQDRLSFTSDSISFNFSGTRFRAGDQIRADVFFMSSPVPEPEAWVMMILGLGALGAAMRRNSRRNRSVSAAIAF